MTSEYTHGEWHISLIPPDIGPMLSQRVTSMFPSQQFLLPGYFIVIYMICSCKKEITITKLAWFADEGNERSLAWHDTLISPTEMFSPCPAENMFLAIFRHFVAGIANAISSFKWRKLFHFWKITVCKICVGPILLTELVQTYRFECPFIWFDTYWKAGLAGECLTL